jgi:hypothetical protein
MLIWRVWGVKRISEGRCIYKAILFLQILEKQGLVKLSKINGLIWVKPKVDLTIMEGC